MVSRDKGQRQCQGHGCCSQCWPHGCLQCCPHGCKAAAACGSRPNIAWRRPAFLPPTPFLPAHAPRACSLPAEVCGDVCSQAALTEHLVRMGEALGMAAVPLTPGGSQAPPPPPAAQQQQLEQQHRQPWGGEGGPEGGSRDEEVDGEAQGGKGAAIGEGGGGDESGDERRRHTTETTED